MIIAACPAVQERSRLVIPNGLPANNLHITVLHFSDDTMATEDPLRISRILRDLTAKHAAFHANALELSRFEKVRHAWENDGTGSGYSPINPTDAVTLLIDAPELHGIRQLIIQELKEDKVSYSTDFKDFKPHITLKYVPHKEEVVLPYPLPISFKLRGLELWSDTSHVFYPFNECANMEAT